MAVNEQSVKSFRSAGLRLLQCSRNNLICTGHGSGYVGYQDTPVEENVDSIQGEGGRRDEELHCMGPTNIELSENKANTI